MEQNLETYKVQPKEIVEHSWENYDEELPTLYGVPIRPMDPLDLSFHSHSSNNPLDVSFHKSFRGKPILKSKRDVLEKLKTNDDELDTETVASTQESNSKETEAELTTASEVVVDTREKRNKSKKRVKWNVLHIREYDVTIGDNPCVSYGPPISLDWCYMNMGTVDVEEYEANRRPRRTMHQMMMNYYYRRHLLIYTCGQSPDDLKRATKGIKKSRLGRAITNAIPFPIQVIEDMTESAIRKTKRVLKKNNTRVYDI